MYIVISIVSNTLSLKGQFFSQQIVFLSIHELMKPFSLLVLFIQILSFVVSLYSISKEFFHLCIDQ